MIRLNHVAKTLRRARVPDDISLDIGPGERIVLLRRVSAIDAVSK